MPELPLGQVITGASPDGWAIDAYFGPVVASVVTGAGLVTEFFAGFSDVFGGRSQSIANRLSELYRDATLDLRRKAALMGANWIVGYRLDFDQVSGKGTFMFMLTVSGTAVRASRKTERNTNVGNATHLSSTEMLASIRRLELVRSPTTKLFANETNWQFASDEQIAELAPIVIQWLVEKEAHANPIEMPQIQAKPTAYFGALSPDVASQELYAALHKDDAQAKVALRLLRDLSLMDLGRTLLLLQEPDSRHRYFALQTLAAHQPAYSHAALPIIDSLRDLIPKSFPWNARVKEVKGLLSTKRVWECASCKYDNPEAQSICGRCSRDKQGFTTKDVTPAAALGALSSIREALVFALHSRSDAA